MNLDATTVVLLPDVNADDAGHLACLARQLLGMVRGGRQVIAVIGAPTPAASGLTALDPFARAGAVIAPAVEAAAALRAALARVGVKAATPAVSAVGPWTRGGPLNAEPRRVRATEIDAAFERASVVVLAGGAGLDEASREAVSLGEGGSALTAAVFAGRLGVDVVVLGDGDPFPRRAKHLAERLGVRARRVPVRGASPAFSLVGKGPYADALRGSERARADADVVVDASREPGLLDATRRPSVVLDPRLAAELVLTEAGDRLSDLGPAASGVIPTLDAIASLPPRDRAVRVQVCLSPLSAAVFDALAAGADGSAALVDARREGLFFGPPGDELSGDVTAQRLAVIASRAFGIAVDWRAIPRRGVRSIDPADVRKIAGFGRRFRLIGTAELAVGPDGVRRVEARVGPLPIRLAEAELASGGLGFVRIETRRGRVLTLRGGVAGGEVLDAAAELAAERLLAAAPRAGVLSA